MCRHPLLKRSANKPSTLARLLTCPNYSPSMPEGPSDTGGEPVDQAVHLELNDAALRFAASDKPASRDKWSRYRLSVVELSVRIVERARVLESR